MKKLLFLVTALLAMVQQSSAQTTPVITVADVKTAPGKTVTLTLNLAGGKADQYTSLQFDAQFPTTGYTIKSEGFTVSDKWTGTDELSKVLCADEDINVDENGIATLPFACAHAITEANVENLVKVSVKVPDDAAIGEHNITLKNIKLGYGLSDKDNPSDVVAKLNIYKLGDTNGDNAVNVVDVANTISCILGETPDDYITVAGDINDDNNINIVDVASTIDIILGDGNAPSAAPLKTQGIDPD